MNLSLWNQLTDAEKQKLWDRADESSQPITDKHVLDMFAESAENYDAAVPSARYDAMINEKCDLKRGK